MRDGEEFEQKLAVLARIQNGSASPADHALAMAWGEQYRLDSLNSASPLDKWMMTVGGEIMGAWPFPATEGSNEKFTYEQILLFAVLYGKSDIENGLLEQFFGNHTGDFAPETADGLEMVKALATSVVIREAMALFGNSYPRDRTARCEMVPALRNELAELSNSFFNSLPPEADFTAACEELMLKSNR